MRPENPKQGQPQFGLQIPGHALTTGGKYSCGSLDLFLFVAVDEPDGGILIFVCLGRSSPSHISIIVSTIRWEKMW